MAFLEQQSPPDKRAQALTSLEGCHAFVEDNEKVCKYVLCDQKRLNIQNWSSLYLYIYIELMPLAEDPNQELEDQFSTNSR